MATTPAVGQDRWKSPLLSPIFDDTKSISPTTTTTSSSSTKRTAVTIPHSGWFAICLTRGNGEEASSQLMNPDIEEQETETSDNQERNHRREAKAGVHLHLSSSSTVQEEDPQLLLLLQHAKCNLRMQLAELGSNELSVPMEPLQDKKGVIVWDVGQLYYFKENSSVSLTINVLADADADDMQQQPSKTKARNPRHHYPLQWYLVSRILEDDCNISSNDKNPEPGSRFQGKKPLLCPICHKLMPNVRGALSHRQARHDTIDTNTTQNGNSEENNNIDDDPHDSGSLPESLEVVYQDDFLAVVNKPQGISVMGGKTSLYRSDLFLPLAGRILHSMESAGSSHQQQQQQQQQSEEEYLRKPMFVHRLDAGTGGLLVLAKTKVVERELKGYFAKRKCQKRYRSLVLGRLEPMEGKIDLPMHGNKPTMTRYQVRHYYSTVIIQDKKANGWVTVVDLFPETGRKHQLRKHMKAVGHPIWGDKRYGGFLPTNSVGKTTVATHDIPVLESDDNTSLLHLMSRLCLWALELTLPHPVTKQKLHFALKDPEWLDFVVQNCASSAEHDDRGTSM